MKRHAIPSVVLALAGCTGRAPEPAERLAVLPLENLSSDPAWDWVGPAVASILVARTSGEADLYSVYAGARRDAARGRASRVLDGYFRSTGAELEARAVIEDPRSGRVVRTISARTPVSGGALALANLLAGQMRARLRPFSTSHAAAIRYFGESMLAETPVHRVALLEKALAADPAFADARFLLAQVHLMAGDRAAAARWIRMPGPPADPASGARLDLLAAMIESRPDAALGALERLSALFPADTESVLQFAGALVNQRRLPEAISAYRRAVSSDPPYALTWNGLAYAQAFHGALGDAAASLAEYKRLDPNGPNPLDSAGEVQFYFGRFAEAGNLFVQAHAKDPAFLGGGTLVKAAESALMRGQTGIAENLFAKYVEARRGSGDASAETQHAQWEFLTGRHGQAIQRLEALAMRRETPPPAAAAAWAQMTIWHLARDDHSRARAASARLRSAAPAAGALPMSLLMEFITLPPASPGVWQARASQAFPGVGAARLGRQAHAVALLLGGHFREAAPLLGAIYQGEPPVSDGVHKLLFAWALVESGQIDQARPLLATHPLPRGAGWDILYPLVFPRCFLLRARVLEKEGNAAAARAQRETLAALTRSR